MKDQRAIERPCEICGALFRPLVSNVQRGRGKTCSIHCRCVKARQSQQAMPRGEASWNFRNGLYVNDREAAHVGRAHTATTRAIKSGKLVPKPCERCGATDRIEAHHPDYSKPLEVKWLCFPCHRALHVEERRRRA